MEPAQETPQTREPAKQQPLRIWLSKSLRWAWVAIRRTFQFLLILWASLAIVYSNLPGWPARGALALAFAAFGVWSLWMTDNRRARWAFGGAFVIVLAWFALIEPSHDRRWRPEVAVLPRAVFVDDDRVRFTGFRNFQYLSEDDFVARREEREVSISRLSGVDLFVSYWNGGRAMAHTFVSFTFDDNAPPVCVSIEFRPEVGETFRAIPSMFKQYELIYVVGDERDIVGLRASHREEEVYLYRIRTSREAAQRLFRIYCQRINELAEQPEFYHGLSNNCTVNIVRFANRAGRAGDWDIRHFVNGFIDRYVYYVGAVDTTLPFDELRQRSRITDVAREAENDERFSERIRE